MFLKKKLRVLPVQMGRLNLGASLRTICASQLGTVGKCSLSVGAMAGPFHHSHAGTSARDLLLHPVSRICE
jgi:hypothetical protein